MFISYKNSLLDYIKKLIPSINKNNIPTDCFVMGSRLVIILDDLLWVLTDSQLKAALHFIDSLGGLIEKATILERKTKAARKLEVYFNIIRI